MSIVPDLRLEQILVRAGSVLDGTTVAAASAAYREATILAIKRANREPIAYPDPEIGLAAGDRVVVLGSPPTLNAMGRQRLPGGRAQEAPDDQEGRRRSVG
jgi:K+/H+ antiporter YhaU regulatory subunit KhtT